MSNSNYDRIAQKYGLDFTDIPVGDLHSGRLEDRLSTMETDFGVKMQHIEKNKMIEEVNENDN